MNDVVGPGLQRDGVGGGPHLHTALPEFGDGHKGERRLAERLLLLGDDDVHLWFGIDYLPSVSDLDLLQWDDATGVFAIEVKAVPVDAVAAASLKALQIAGRSGTRHPLSQAKQAVDQLAGLLRDSLEVRPPWLHVSAWFPEIDRGEWVDRWREEPLMRRQAEGMLFRDDLLDLATLRARLATAMELPAWGGGTRRRHRRNQALLSQIAAILDPTPTLVTMPHDVDRLRDFQLSVDKELYARYPVGRQHRVAFNGPPGTGKTYRLLQMALEQVRSGNQVLFLTFNKVLAADLRRWVHASPDVKGTGGAIDVVDAWQFLKRYVDVLPRSDDDAGDEVVTLLRQERTGLFYDAVFVDEAQGMRQWVFELASWTARADATWFVAIGSGQELYGDHSAWLTTFETAADRQELVTVHRNHSADFVAARLFWRHAPDAAALKRVPKPPRPHSTGQESGQESLFDEVQFIRSTGQLPRLVPVPNGDESVSQREQLVTGYGALVQSQLTALEREGDPGDLAILVESADGASAGYAREALRTLGINHQDLTPREARRQVPDPSQPRILTYHSARGVEAGRVLVLGFHRLHQLGHESAHRNLGYIALSRARNTTTVAVPALARETGPYVPFLQSLLAAMAARGWGAEPEGAAPESRRDPPPGSVSAPTPRRSGVPPVEQRASRPAAVETVVPQEAEASRWRKAHVIRWDGRAGIVEDAAAGTRLRLRSDRLFSLSAAGLRVGGVVHSLAGTARDGQLQARMVAPAPPSWMGSTRDGAVAAWIYSVHPQGYAFAVVAGAATDVHIPARVMEKDLALDRGERVWVRLVEDDRGLRAIDIEPMG